MRALCLGYRSGSVSRTSLGAIGAITALVCLFCLIPLSARAMVIDTFERGDEVGWSLVGDGSHMSDFSMQAGSPGKDSAFCLRLTSKSEFWSGVQAPNLAWIATLGPRSISLDARGSGGCGQICVDLQQSDGSRWWRIIDLPADGSWQHITATPDNFFAITNPANASKPDFAKPSTLWLTMRLAPGAKPTAESPAVMEIDNVEIGCTREASYAADGTASPKPASLRGVSVVVADTGKLPGLGQDASAPATISKLLETAGANVTVIEPGSLSGTLPSESVLIWEGPACAKGDWEAVEAYLRKGGALLWMGAGQPFLRPVDSPADDTPSRILTQGTYHTAHALSVSGDFKLTDFAKKLWPEFPTSLPPQTCRYLTTNDSIYLNTHWPWVDFIPLVTLGYQSRSWIWSDSSAFTGTPATLFRHHAGDHAGARIALVCVAANKDSIFSPQNRGFPYWISRLVRELAKPISVDPKLARIPKPGPTLTPANFFSYPGSVIGALDYDVRWSDPWARPDYKYAANRLGMNMMSAGIPWLYDPAPDGSVIDWAKTDRVVADAEKGGWGVVFDSLVFDGFGAYSWARASADGDTTPASIYNPLFKARYARAVAGLAARYANRPAVVAFILPPHTNTSMFGVDPGSVAQKAWAQYAAKRGLGPELPKQPEKGKLDFSPARAAYVDFWADGYLEFMRHVIRSVRRVSPKLPLLIRGPYMDVALSFRLASEFEGVAPHCECVETSVDVDAYMRGFAQRYGTPVSAENGWPKERGPALRMAVACTLMGGYSDLLFSFGGSVFARPGLPEFEALQRVWPNLKGAKYAKANVGLLIADTTIWAADPPNYQWAEGQANTAMLMERTGVPFVAVSAQWPKLEGLDVLVDDGRNYAFSPEALASLTDWVENGGTLIAYPTTGQYSSTGIGATLRTLPGYQLTEGEHRVGKGRIIVLASVPTDQKHSLAGNLRNLLLSRCNQPPAIAREWVNQAAFVKGNNTYLVVYNKSKDLVGAFFDEARLPAAIAALPSLRLTIDAPKGATSARELLTGRKLEIRNGVVKLNLPATWWRVVEFEIQKQTP